MSLDSPRYSLPFEFVHPGAPILVVKAVMPDKSVRRFLLDTGNASEHILLSQAEAKRLKIQTEPYTSPQKQFAVGESEKLTAEIGTLAALTVGGLRMRDVPALVTPSVDDLATAMKSDFVGNFGYTFLKPFAVTFDYESMALNLESCPQAPKGAGQIHINPAMPLIVVDVAVHGAGLRKFVIDTGASADVVSRRLMADLGLPSQRKVPMLGGNGKDEADLVEIPAISFGGFDVAAKPGVSAEFVAELAEVAGMDIDGVVGYPTLSQLRLTIDYKNGLWWVDPPTE